MNSLETPIMPLGSFGQDPQLLAGQFNSRDPHSVDAVATSFEGMFISIMMKQMRGTLESGSFFGNDNADVYGGLFDLYMGQHLAQGGGIGIAAMIKRQLQKDHHD
jgi:Rod binding domain-containing protein